MTNTKPVNRALLNLLGVLGVSLCWGVGGPLSFVILQDLSPPDANLGRCGFAFLGLLPFFFFDAKKMIKDLSTQGFWLIAASGLLLGVHFYFFISGVAYASLATAVTLVAVEPALVLLIGRLVFNEKISFKSFLGILLCIFGIVVISVLPHFFNKDFAYESARIYGDFCAVMAVITYAIYYGLNRAFRPHEKELSNKLSPLRRGFSLALIIYFFAFFSAAVLSVGTHLLNGTTGHAPVGKTWLALLAVGYIPTVLGHTLNQIVSRVAHPVWVSLMSPGETLMALLIGFLFLDQSMQSFEIIGSLLILAGVSIVAWNEGHKN